MVADRTDKLPLEIHANDLVRTLLSLPENEPVALLDSCGVGHLGSHLLIAGIDPVNVQEVSDATGEAALALLADAERSQHAAIFTLSYELGAKLAGASSRQITPEPDIFLASFDVLIIHDYDTGHTYLAGNSDKFEATRRKLADHTDNSQISDIRSEIPNKRASSSSDLTKLDYLSAIADIQERIRCGDTYQTNLTQQFTVMLREKMKASTVFSRLRRDHPAPFAAFIKRTDSNVISASPERFFRIEDGRISTSPIKGTRRRGTNAAEDAALRDELLTSKKDRAENTMIVDLLRNDLGRVCEYGRVVVEKLCDIEEHPTLFHLVSTVSGKLRSDAQIVDVIRALFPCGSITGAPKISTMKIIDEIEPSPRGLSMGAIGCCLPDSMSPSGHGFWDLSVAIRTMVVRDGTAIFNTGGGIVIDSDPEGEYDEMNLKAKALLAAL